jgi:histidinol-phosphatase (PHP family)
MIQDMNERNSNIRTCDCHVHTLFSPDSTQPMEPVCARAVELGLDAICFTEHLDFDVQSLGYYRPEAYFAELERMREAYAGQLRILAGLELSEPHRHQDELALAQKRPYDFILGSVHYWNGGLFPPNMLAQGMTAEYIYETYWEEILQMARCGGFDAMAHLDFPKRYLNDVLCYDPAKLDSIFAAAVQNGLALEVNSSSLRCGCREAMPGEAMLRQYIAAGGTRITLGADAHIAQHLNSCLPEARKKAEALGLRPVCFVGRKAYAL